MTNKRKTSGKEQAAARGEARAERSAEPCAAQSGETITVVVSRDDLLTMTATMLIARTALRRIRKCGSDVLARWLMPVEDALEAVYDALMGCLSGNLEKVAGLDLGGPDDDEDDEDDGDAVDGVSFVDEPYI